MVAVLCALGWNACILFMAVKKPHYTNEILTIIMQKALESVPNNRAIKACRLQQFRFFKGINSRYSSYEGHYDLVIPRGSKQLIQTVISDSIIRVIENREWCWSHLYR